MMASPQMGLTKDQAAAFLDMLGIKIPTKEYTADVERTGDKIILPEGADIPEVISVLQRKHNSENQVVQVRADIEVPPWDGSLALQKAITEELGLVLQDTNWQGKAAEIDVEVELGKSVPIKWGVFTLPGMGEDAKAMTDVSFQNGDFKFTCIISCKRLYEDRARKILDRMRLLARTESIHKGKAFSLRFLDEDGDILGIPQPTFFPLWSEKPIFRRELELAIERNVFVPLRHSKDLLAMGEPLKRGVLFAGDYGTGKTMLASYIGREAVHNNWTFIYVKDARELPLALRYAQRLQPCVVFAEDVDRIAGGERTNSVNNLLNQLDGIDNKSTEIMTVLTSNHPEQINAAMRRPGRIDLILKVLPPDEEAVGRMVHHFSRGGIEADADLSGITSVLNGYAPAHVREAVGRARLEALRRTGDPKALINGDDLEAVAKEVREEHGMFSHKDKDRSSTLVAAVADGFDSAASAMRRHSNMNGEERAATAN